MVNLIVRMRVIFLALLLLISVYQASAVEDGGPPASGGSGGGGASGGSSGGGVSILCKLYKVCDTNLMSFNRPAATGTRKM